MNKVMKIIVIALAVVIVGTAVAIPLMASAQESAESSQEVPEETGAAMSEEEAFESEEVIISQVEAQTKSTKSMAAAIVVGIAAAAGAIGMALAICKSVEGAARQPEASSKIQTMLMLGLVFIETAIIYALIVAILIIFVL